jgi:hypothetical protein
VGVDPILTGELGEYMWSKTINLRVEIFKQGGVILAPQKETTGVL